MGELMNQHTLHVDQFIALNDEIAALVRAGVPLPHGLRELGRDVPGRLGAAAEALGHSLESGTNLLDALADDRTAFPPAYRAVVAAGLRAGRLPAALEGISASARRAAETRRLIGVAILYPLLVLLIAYGLFVLLTLRGVPVLVEMYADSRLPANAILSALERLDAAVLWWAPWPPLIVCGLFAAWWFRSGQATAIEAPRRERWRSPSQVRAWSALCIFTDLLALLIEHNVPLAEAVTYSGDACGDERIERDARELSSRLTRGQRDEILSPCSSGIPAVLRWLLTTDAGQPRLVAALRQTSQTYHDHAAEQAAWLSWYLPLILTSVIGGTATLLYALACFLPWCWLLYKLSLPV